jgi:hypothetical protein
VEAAGSLIEPLGPIMIEQGARKPDLCRKLLLVAVLAAFCQPNVAQSQAAPQAAKAAGKVPEFEVASIKPNASGLGMMRFIFTPDGCSATNISLDFLVSNAYGISRDLISGGPSWIVSSRYDVEAKVAGADVAEWHRLEVSQRNSMLFRDRLSRSASAICPKGALSAVKNCVYRDRSSSRVEHGEQSRA